MKLVDTGKRKLPKGWLRTPDDPAEYETVGAWRHAFVQRFAAASNFAGHRLLLLFAVAVIITWIVPTEPS